MWVCQKVCIFNFETLSSLYRALYGVQSCIPNILDGIELHQAPLSPEQASQNFLFIANTRIGPTASLPIKLDSSFLIIRIILLVE